MHDFSRISNPLVAESKAAEMPWLIGLLSSFLQHVSRQRSRTRRWRLEPYWYNVRRTVVLCGIKFPLSGTHTCDLSL